MQLAGLLDDDLRAGAGGLSLRQKFKQAVSCQGTVARWRKGEILEVYLNLVQFCGGLLGIDALSLDEREAALATTLVRAPSAKAAQVAEPGHAGQLSHRFFAAQHRRGMGRQCQRRGAGLGCADESLAPSRAARLARVQRQQGTCARQRGSMTALAGPACGSAA